MLNTSSGKLLNTRILWTIGIVALTAAGVASGQGRRPDATLDELVIEVQALRAEMNQAAAAQVLVGRLQMEDQRIAGVLRDLEAVQAELTAAAQARADATARVKLLEGALTSAGADTREAVQHQLETAMASVQQAERRAQGLRRRENVLTKELQEDQRRWEEINQRLESFEQAIAVRR